MVPPPCNDVAAQHGKPQPVPGGAPRPGFRAEPGTFALPRHPNEGWKHRLSVAFFISRDVESA
jgi:hypothetical protein